MIKDMKLNLVCDQRGKITTGIKSTSSGGKEIPKAVDYFVIDKFPEIIQEYGQKPNKLIIAFPTNDINSLFDCNYVAYGNETKLRQCDGETCIHRIDENIDGEQYKAGQETKCICKELAENHKKRCRYVMYLKAWILKKNGSLLSPNIYLFTSGSKNTGDNIYSELEKVRFLNNEILQHIPFGLSVKMISGKEDAKKTFPIWTLQAIPRTQLGGEVQFQLPEHKARTEQ